MTIEKFIKKRPHLVWDTNQYKDLSEGAVVRAVLQHGDFQDVKQLLTLLGTDRVARIFRNQLKQRRVNYDPKIANYFSLYFKAHAK